jgi:DNA replication initiation complex subunit (GINS family)
MSVRSASLMNRRPTTGHNLYKKSINNDSSFDGYIEEIKETPRSSSTKPQRKESPSPYLQKFNKRTTSASFNPTNTNNNNNSTFKRYDLYINNDSTKKYQPISARTNEYLFIKIIETSNHF